MGLKRNYNFNFMKVRVIIPVINNQVLLPYEDGFCYNC